MKKLLWPVALIALVSLASFAQTPSRPPITGISHLAVYTTNAEAADHFYTHDIGLKKASDPENLSGVRYYVNSTQFVEVLPLPSNAGKSRFDHIGYITTDAEALRAYLAAHSYAVPSAVQHGSDGSLWFDLKDPESNKVQFVQPPPRPAMVESNSVGNHIIHAGMLVKSADTENTFYRDLLGFRPYWFGGMKPDRTDWVSQQVPDGHDWLEYMLEAGNSSDISQRQYGVLDHLSIGVANMEKAVTMLDSEGRLDDLRDQHNAMQIGRDGKWQFNLYDPDGTRLEYMEFAPVRQPCCSPFTAPNPSAGED